MTTYYIDTMCCKKNNDGLSEETPICDYRLLDVKPGDTVLFKCGSIIRNRLNNISGLPGAPITYASYGKGEKPTFCGSINLSDKELWHEEEKNIWSCMLDGIDETANIIFNNSDLCATLRWSRDELSEQGDFYDNCLGVFCGSRKKEQVHYLYLYSKKNPAEFYSSIECAACDKISLANNGENIIFENLRFINNGLHAIAGESGSRNVVVKNCTFEHIGGAVYDKDKKIRYGNAVEFWNVAENVQVTECLFNDIYDSAVTHQGSHECKPANGFIISDNVFIKCGMAAYEQRDRMPVNSSFSENICISAGEGFSKNGIEMPRMSEIWPQPMGHHVFLWRINNKSEHGCLKIENNIFYNAPYGAAIYSIISKCAEEQITLKENIYYTENKNLLSHWNGNDYKSFDSYKSCDVNCKNENVDIAEILIHWKKSHIKD